MSTGWDSDDHLYEAPLFQQEFVCLPFDRYKNPELETGNKIVMPPSSLSLIAALGMRCPWFFKIESFGSDKASHCGVLEFCAEEGSVYVPRWMMDNLSVGDGDRVLLRDARPLRATWMLLRPHATAFIEVSNVRAVLETALRGFSCLSKGDTLAIGYNGEEFKIDVLDVGPGGEVVSLIDTDCEVEFAPPLDYVEPPPPPAVEMEEVEGEEEGEEEFRPFTGMARRLDGGEVVAAEGGGGAAAVEEYGGKEEREGVREFRPFEGVARRLDGGGGGSVAVEGAPAKEAAAAGAEKKREKEEEKKFKPFAGRGRVLGGPNFFD
ncbi:uncharacterized protein LOC130994526 [Salvia miltiorrhiza]|uniref:uncharacterized protein LOC130994526 n=1 Tax=Salvia miltiorrhiza TaxID=226208 RepID=UPI0025AD53BC|nr:uncharacterized protein LOC130994526 [Salvia miltiorrhiza]